jgi:BirA family biotin operon repressor/biotin-[acetyl-CoA-carboxylase] ligase
MVACVTGTSATPGVDGTRFRSVQRIAATGSTNADLLAAAADGAEEGLVLVAEHQTAGRGRLDRRWEAPPGASLLVSVLLRPTLEPDDAFLLTTATGVSAVAACQDVAGVLAGLKWPNDLVVVADGLDRDHLDGRKLGGILAEARLAADRLDAVVIGMGLNVNWPPTLPPDLTATAAALNHLVGREIDRDALLASWLRHLDGWLVRLGDGRGTGRDALLDRARECSATLGRTVQVELPGGEVLVGEAVELTDGGHLLVSPASGAPAVEVTVGDVVHARLAR